MRAPLSVTPRKNAFWGMATTAPPEPATQPPTWHVLTREGAVRELHVEPESGLTSEEAAERLAQLRAQPLRRGQGRAALARVPAPVPRPDADRAPGRRRHLDLPRQAARDRDHDPAADAAQRGARPQPGGQGRRGGRGAGEDDDRQGARAPRRQARPAARGAARARRRGRDRGGRRGARGRPRAVGGDAGGRRGGADRREPARGQGRRAPSRRPTPRSAIAPTWST